MAELRDATGESVQLYVRDGDRRGVHRGAGVAARVEDDRADGRQPSARRRVRRSRAMGAESMGQIVSNRRPWAESVGEREAGVASVSAPVLDASGAVVAAVSVSGPIERTSRHPARKYAEAVVTAAHRIERDAGLRPRP